MTSRSSDEDDITIISLPSDVRAMDQVDGDFTGSYPARAPHAAPIPEFHIYSNSHDSSQRLPESLHALSVAYNSLKQRFNDLQQKNIELEKKMQSQRQTDGLDFTDYRYPARTSLEFDGTSPGPARPTGDGLSAHGGRRSPEMELEQENEILQKQKLTLERQLHEREAECEMLRIKLKDMEDICQQITSAQNAVQFQKQDVQADSVDAEEERDEDTEESETTTELTEKYADMMREIMSELNLSKRTIEQQQQMIENLQQRSKAANGGQGSSSGGAHTRGDAEGQEHVAHSSCSPAGARPKSRVEESRPVDPVQCTDSEIPGSGYSPAPLSDWTTITPQESDLLGPVTEPKRAAPIPIPTRSVVPTNTRPKSVSVTAPISTQQTKVPKLRSLSSSMEPLSDSPYRGQHRGRIESDSVDSAAVLPDRFDVFGRPNQDKKFEHSALTTANIFSDNADDLYGNDTDSKRAELRRRQSDRDVSDGSRPRYELLRQSWPASASQHQQPSGSMESNRHRIGSQSHVPRPLNIDRNVDEAVGSRSYDNIRNVNLLVDPTPAPAAAAAAGVHGVLNNDPLVATKPVPRHNIYQEGQDLTVKLPPVEQAERVEEPKTCPVCSQDFPAAYAQSDFEEHVVVCLNSSSGENSPGGGDKHCPVCNEVFSKDAAQMEFEEHVNGHFDDFEVVPRGTPEAEVPNIPLDNFGSPRPSEC